MIIKNVGLIMIVKKTVRKNKTTTNSDQLKKNSKTYKITMQKAGKDFRKSFEQNIKNLKSTNPKQYWKILNYNKQNKNHTLPDLTSLYDHFKTLNKNIDNPEIPINNNTRSELDFEFSDEEILQAIKTLKKNKATGNDGVLSKYICSTINIFLPIFKNLFIYILMSGNIPEEWVIGNIIPVYENKGDTSSPENDRHISLLSCFGIFFTSLINTLLTYFLNSSKVLLENQTGFRRGYSTMDHVITLKSLIDIFLHEKNKLFCAFVDFKKAFDTVWRSGLWIKLISFGITGKLFNVIRNIYNIKSCVQVNGQKSDYFSCYTGVRLGENLSPHLFSLYLNDLESFLKYNHVNNLKLSDNIFDQFLKIQILLYADDTVLLSDNADGLQYS